MAAGPLERRRPRLVVAAALAVVAVGGSVGASHRAPDAGSLDVGGVLLLLVAPVVLAVALRRRVVAVVATVVALGAYLALGYPWGPVFGSTTGVLVGLVLTGPVRSGRVAAWSGLAALAVVVPVAFALRGDPLRPGVATGGVAWVCVVLLAAGAVRTRTERLAEQRAARAAADARRETDAVTAERLRIARELHDVLAHSLSAITVQAGVGLHLLDRDVEQARSALTSIRATSRDALDEVRAVLGVVRADGGPGAGGGDDVGARETAGARAPTWTLDALPALVAASGPGAVLTVDLPPDGADRLPAHLAGVVYRVVQEALTNVRRHAPSATAVDVVVDAPRPGTLRVRVVDDGPGVATGVGVGVGVGVGGTVGGRLDRAVEPLGAAGFGLLGMRERVEGVGGALRVGARGDGRRGFEVEATVPCTRSAR